MVMQRFIFYFRNPRDPELILSFSREKIDRTTKQKSILNIIKNGN